MQWLSQLANEFSGTSFYSEVMPTPVVKPNLLLKNQLLYSDLKIDLADNDFAEVLAGNRIEPGMRPLATYYGGHQFGHWADALGDGRAIILGELKKSSGEICEIQLKGAGSTPYSRRGDGRAVLRSSLREYLCSESMHFLGIATTRALGCVLTGEMVERDMFYDGRPQFEPGAITARVAPSFMRFGHLEIYAAHGEYTMLEKVLRYFVEKFDSDAISNAGNIDLTYWFDKVAKRTMDLLIQWMRVGFVHGVMNTDNMSLLGLTIDYGPYGWIENFDPLWTPNTTDRQHRRYRYGTQLQIGLWNLARLAETLLPLGAELELLQKSLQNAADTAFLQEKKMWQDKMGLIEENPQLQQQILKLFEDFHLDMTIGFRTLPDLYLSWVSVTGDSERAAVFKLWLEKSSYKKIISAEENELALDLTRSWFQHLQKVGWLDEQTSLSQKQKMNSINPYFVLRNWQVQEILDDLEGAGRQKLQDIQSAILSPYSENEVSKQFFVKRPDWALHRAGCSMLSCSS